MSFNLRIKFLNYFKICSKYSIFTKKYKIFSPLPPKEWIGPQPYIILLFIKYLFNKFFFGHTFQSWPEFQNSLPEILRIFLPNKMQNFSFVYLQKKGEVIRCGWWLISNILIIPQDNPPWTTSNFVKHDIPGKFMSVDLLGEFTIYFIFFLIKCKCISQLEEQQRLQHEDTKNGCVKSTCDESIDCHSPIIFELSSTWWTQLMKVSGSKTDDAHNHKRGEIICLSHKIGI